MQSPHTTTSRRLAASLTILTGLLLLSGCASLRRSSESEAIASARAGVCGPQVADSTCIVRAVERAGDGYRVVLDRYPPAGRDRVAVLVRGAGWLGTHSIEVTPIDTSARGARP